MQWFEDVVSSSVYFNIWLKLSAVKNTSQKWGRYKWKNISLDEFTKSWYSFWNPIYQLCKGFSSNFNIFFFLATLCSLQDLSSLTRDWTPAPAMKAPSPNHWTSREFPEFHLFWSQIVILQINQKELNFPFLKHRFLKPIETLIGRILHREKVLFLNVLHWEDNFYKWCTSFSATKLWLW